MFGLGLRKIPFGGLVLTLHKFNPEDNFGFKACIGVILVNKKIWCRKLTHLYACNGGFTAQIPRGKKMV